jgi:hypothetical protein
VKGEGAVKTLTTRAPEESGSKLPHSKRYRELRRFGDFRLSFAVLRGTVEELIPRSRDRGESQVSSQQKNWLSGMDSNHDKELQRLLCYHYTTGQRVIRVAACSQNCKGKRASKR